MKRIHQILIYAFAVFGCALITSQWGCNCENEPRLPGVQDLFLVVNIEKQADSVISIQFSDPVDKATLVLNNTLRLEGFNIQDFFWPDSNTVEFHGIFDNCISTGLKDSCTAIVTLLFSDSLQIQNIIGQPLLGLENNTKKDTLVCISQVEPFMLTGKEIDCKAQNFLLSFNHPIDESTIAIGENILFSNSESGEYYLLDSVTVVIPIDFTNCIIEQNKKIWVDTVSVSDGNDTPLKDIYGQVLDLGGNEELKKAFRCEENIPPFLADVFFQTGCDSIVICFNKPVDRTTVLLDNTVIVEGFQQTSEPKWIGDKFTLCGFYTDCELSPANFYQCIASISLTNRVKSLEGQAIEERIFTSDTPIVTPYFIASLKNTSCDSVVVNFSLPVEIASVNFGQTIRVGDGFNNQDHFWVNNQTLVLRGNPSGECYPPLGSTVPLCDFNIYFNTENEFISSEECGYPLLAPITREQTFKLSSTCWR